MSDASRPAFRRTLMFVVTEDWYFVTHRLTLAKRAIAEGYRVVVVTRTEKHAEVIRQAGCELLPIPIRRRSHNPFFELASIWRLARLYRRERPDIVHQVALKPVLYGSIAATLARVPSVMNAIAGLGFAFTSDRWIARVTRPAILFSLRRLLRRPNAWVLVQNPDDRRIIEDRVGVAPERILLVPGVGVELDLFQPRPGARAPGPLRVVMASRMLWDKGVGEFVAAARALREQGREIRMILVGDSDAASPSAIPPRQLAEWRDAGVVEWLGKVEEMPSVWADADVCCFPSKYGEGVPKVLLEAAAAGLPIVTTDIPGCRLVVEHERNGLLVPQRDVGALVQAIERLADDPALRRRLGEASRARAVAEFDVRAVGTKILELYQRSLARDAAILLLLVTEEGFVRSHWRPLIAHARGRGYTVVVATRLIGDGRDLAELGVVPMHVEWRRGGRNPLAEARTILEIIRLYRDVRPDLVHHIAVKPVLYGSFAALWGGRPRVVNALSGLGYIFLGEGLLAATLRSIAITAFRWVADQNRSVMIFENADDQALFRKLGIIRRAQTAQVSGAGVRLDAYLPGTPIADPPQVLLPSRMLWDKGVGEFVEAARRLRARGVRARFLLAGGRDPANPAQIELATLEEWRREGAVEWLDHRDDIPQLMAQSALIVLPSYREGLPKVLAEACAAGRAIVTTDVPGCRAVVEDGVNGRLVPVRDAGALADAIAELLADPARREAMGEAGRARAEARYGEASVTAGFARAYESIHA